MARLTLSRIPVSTLDSSQHQTGDRLTPLQLPQGRSSNSTASSQHPGPADTGRGPGTWQAGAKGLVGAMGVSEKLEAE